MDEASKEKIKKLKIALLEYLGTNGRYYGQLSRLEQSVEDLAQALNTRLDQLLLAPNECLSEVDEGSPTERLAGKFMEYSNKLYQGGNVDKDVADEFEKTLGLLDIAADLKRQSETVRDAAETSAIKHKRSKS